MVPDMRATLRQRGKIARTRSTVVDFNRHGIAVLTRDRLEKHKLVFLSLRCGGIHLDNVVGVIHNCIAQGGQYRCGIQFRTQSELQFDKNLVERTLDRIEALLSGDDQAQALAAQ